jgi:hypothetical protein
MRVEIQKRAHEQMAANRLSSNLDRHAPGTGFKLVAQSVFAVDDSK